MPSTEPPLEWFAEAGCLYADGKPIKCWRCAVTVDADKITLSGRCTAPGTAPDPCPLNAVAKLATKSEAA